MIEVEVKHKIANVNMCISDFLELGFERDEYVEEVDTYYTSDFHDFKANDEALRVRQCKDLRSGKQSAYVTFKGKKLDNISMSRKEIETGVEDVDAFSQIMESIGFRPVTPVKKVRVSLTKGNITVCVDDVEGLGGFLEVEILVKDESMRENALKDISELLESVGMSINSTIRKSYLSMLEEL